MPDLRPFRALRFDASSVGDIGAVVAPPYDVIDEATRARLVERHPPTSSGSTSRSRRLATSPTTAIGERPRRSPPGGPMGPCARTHTVDLRLRAGLPGAGHRCRADAAGFLRPPEAGVVRAGCRRAAARAHAERAQGRPLQAAPGDRREHQPRSSACSTIPADGRRSGWRRSPQGRLAPTSSTTTACAIARGRCPRRRWPGERRHGRAARGRRNAAWSRHRRWPPSLRDRTGISRRAHDPLVRGGPAVRLPAGAAASRRPARH